MSDLRHSIHQRLLNKAKELHRLFNEVLQYYAIECFLSRLSKSRYNDRFILKGALALKVLGSSFSRPTRDIDMTGMTNNSIESVISVMQEICSIVVEDGVAFDSDSINAARIVEDAVYSGVRVKIQGNLGKIKLNLQVDLAFGDSVYPGAITMSYPSILESPIPGLKIYPIESTIAEKFQAMIALDSLNSRMKDFYDLWALSQTKDFDGKVLAEAIRKTFQKRKTEIPDNPTVFHPEFSKEKEKQWIAFLKKSDLTEAPQSFEMIIERVKEFLMPVLIALKRGEPFASKWIQTGPWQK